MSLFKRLRSLRHRGDLEGELEEEVRFHPERILYARLATPSATYDRSHQKALFMEQVLQRVKSLPGVSAAAVAHSQLPCGP
jgi:hypothetical protein